MYNTSLSVGPSRFSEGGNISLGRYQNGELAVVVVHPNTGERQSVATGHRTPVRSSFYRPRPIISGSRAGARTRVSPKRSSGRDPQRLRNPSSRMDHHAKRDRPFLPGRRDLVFVEGGG